MAIDTAARPNGGADAGHDLVGLARHVEALLRRGLAPSVTFHDPAHTLEYVVPAADRLALAETVSGHARILIHAAALLHDTGYTVASEDHERISAGIARESLPRFGFSHDEIERIAVLIMATKLGREPETLEERILADADLDVLGREDFWPRSLALRSEMAAAGVTYDDVSWAEMQLEFLRGHRYHTESARRLRLAGKSENVRLLKDRLLELKRREADG